MRAVAHLRAPTLDPSARSVAFADAEPSGGLSPWAIVAVSVGGGVALVALYVLLKWRRRRRAQELRGNDNLYLQAETPTPSGHGDDAYAFSAEGTEATPRESGSDWITSQFLIARIPVDAIQRIEVTGRELGTTDWRAIYRDELVTVKMLDAERRDLAQLRAFTDEMRCVSSLHHACIVGFVGVAWETPNDPWLVLEHASSDLRQRMTEYDTSGHPNGFDAEKLRIAFQVASALAYLHGLARCLIHRNITSGTIILTESGDAKLSGFGVAQQHRDYTMTTAVGTVRWMAPEVMLGGNYDERADVYSLGVVLSELDTQKLPYDELDRESEYTLVQYVSSRQLKPRFTDAADPSVVKLALECLEFEPEMRPTAADVMYRLEQLLEHMLAS